MEGKRKHQDGSKPTAARKKPVNLTLNDKVLSWADEIMEKRGFTSLSTFVEELVRLEYERLQTPVSSTRMEADASRLIALLEKAQAAGGKDEPKE